MELETYNEFIELNEKFSFKDFIFDIKIKLSSSINQLELLNQEKGKLNCLIELKKGNMRDLMKRLNKIDDQLIDIKSKLSEDLTTGKAIKFYKKLFPCKYDVKKK